MEKSVGSKSKSIARFENSDYIHDTRQLHSSSVYKSSKPLSNKLFVSPLDNVQ